MALSVLGGRGCESSQEAGACLKLLSEGWRRCDNPAHLHCCFLQPTLHPCFSPYLQEILDPNEGPTQAGYQVKKLRGATRR